MTNTNRLLDRKVWLTMGVSSLLALGLLSYKAITYVDCDQYHIQVHTFHDDTDGIAGEEIEFIINVDNDVVLWHFGDGSEPLQGQKVRHKFFKSGTFTVTAEVEGHCIQFENINIRLKSFPTNAELNAMQEGIYGDSVVAAGNTLTLISTTTANDYAWQVIGQA